MKLRLTGSGFENFTGQMGAHEFLNGVSTTDVTERDAIRLSGVFHTEWVDPSVGVQHPSLAQRLLDNGSVEATNNLQLGAQGEAAPEVVVEPKKVWTEADLAAVADRDGIKGLREIADPLGLKSNSILELINLILEKA